MFDANLFDEVLDLVEVKGVEDVPQDTVSLLKGALLVLLLRRLAGHPLKVFINF